MWARRHSSLNLETLATIPPLVDRKLTQLFGRTFDSARRGVGPYFPLLAASGSVWFSMVACSVAASDAAVLEDLGKGFGMKPVATKRAEFKEPVAVFGLAFSPDGTKIATSSPYTEEVHVWSWQRHPEILQSLEQKDDPFASGGGGQANGLRFSPDGSILVSAHIGSGEHYEILRAWNSVTGAVVGHVTDRWGNMHEGLAFSPDGRLLVRSQPGGRPKGAAPDVMLDTFIVHDTKTWEPLWALKTEPVAPTALAMSSDGHYVALSGWERRERDGAPYLQYTVLVIDLLERGVKKSVEIPSGVMDLIAWSPDGQRIVVAGGTVVAVDFSSGKVSEYASHAALPVALMHTPDGKRLLIAWSDGVEIWDAGHTKLVQRIPGRLVQAAALSPDGRYLAFAQDTQVGIWEVR
jgi:WD40 repeat protein